MAATLMQAIHEQWIGSGDLVTARPTLVDDNPMAGRDPGTYAVLCDLEQPEKPDDFEGGRKVDATWTLRTWAMAASQNGSRNAAESVAALMRAAFQGQPLEVDGHFCLKVRVKNTRVRLDEKLSTPARLVHVVELSFLADLHRRTA